VDLCLRNEVTEADYRGRRLGRVKLVNAFCNKNKHKFRKRPRERNRLCALHDRVSRYRWEKMYNKCVPVIYAYDICVSKRRSLGTGMRYERTLI
jgi:hypothetical protein